jgi:hypothetical protein
MNLIHFTTFMNLINFINFMNLINFMNFMNFINHMNLINQSPAILSAFQTWNFGIILCQKLFLKSHEK